MKRELSKHRIGRQGFALATTLLIILVLSVIAVGAAWLASRLQRRGHKVVLATRGYGRCGGGGVRVVSDGRHVYADVETAGDEALLLAAHAPGVPVLVGRDRGVAGLRAVAAIKTLCLRFRNEYKNRIIHTSVLK